MKDFMKSAEYQSILTEAVKKQIEDMKEYSVDAPFENYWDQGFGIFCLWLDLAGYEVDEENDKIAAMREYCIGWTK